GDAALPAADLDGDDRGIAHAIEGAEGVLDLGRVDEEAAEANGIAAAGQVDEAAVLAQAAEVAAAKEAVRADRGGGGVGVAEVAAEIAGGADLDLADHARRGELAGPDIAYPHLGARHGRIAAALGAFLWAAAGTLDREQRLHLAGAVEAEQGDAGVPA